MSAGENNSTRKMAIEKYAKRDGSQWIRVLLLKYGTPSPSFIPSLLDLHRIIQAIAECEDDKYPPPAKGRAFLEAFLRDCVRMRDYQQLAQKYNIPEREGDEIIRTNGARLRDATTTTACKHKPEFLENGHCRICAAMGIHA